MRRKSSINAKAECEIIQCQLDSLLHQFGSARVDTSAPPNEEPVEDKLQSINSLLCLVDASLAKLSQARANQGDTQAS